jgi:hypothetical protein
MLRVIVRVIVRVFVRVRMSEREPVEGRGGEKWRERTSVALDSPILRQFIWFSEGSEGCVVLATSLPRGALRFLVH